MTEARPTALTGVATTGPAGPASDPSGSAADPDMLAERRRRNAEAALHAARRRATVAEDAAAELAIRVEQLERELEQAGREHERLAALLAAADRASRAAEQRAHAELVLREQLQEQVRAELVARARQHEDAGAVLAELAAVEERVRGLEAEIDGLARRADEADHATAAARAARERAQRRVLELTAETETAKDPAPGRGRVIAPGTGAELAIAAGIRAELAIGDGSGAGGAGGDGAGAGGAGGDGAGAGGAIPGRGSGAIASTPPGLAAVPEEDASRLGAGVVEPERLDAALSRLREATPIQARAQAADRARSVASARRAWLTHVFRALTERDPVAAGRLALALLPAQHLVHPDPLAYDLVLDDVGCVRVGVRRGDPADADLTRVALNELTCVELGDSPRARWDVSFQVLGDLSSLARLLGAGPLRRRLGRGLAGVSGDRRALRALIELVRAPLTLEELDLAGVRLQPSLALSVAALMVDPSWTEGERFTIAHQQPGAETAAAHLRIRDGGPPSVTDFALGPVAATIVCPGDSLLPVLGGAVAVDGAIRGEERPPRLLRSWLKRAQSG